MPAPNKLKPQWFNILLALSDGERHGQGIMAEVLRQTEGSMRLWPTSLYGSLKRLSESGLLEESIQEGTAGEGDRRRFYRITQEGRQTLALEITRLQRTVDMALRKQGAAK